MDEVANDNRARWDALVEAYAVFTRPDLKLDACSARQKIDPEGWPGELSGKRRRPSAAFALV